MLLATGGFCVFFLMVDPFIDRGKMKFIEVLKTNIGLCLIICHPSFVYPGGQDVIFGKAFDSQAERYWVRFSLRPQKALNMSD
jgi:hypothetical protein